MPDSLVSTTSTPVITALFGTTPEATRAFTVCYALLTVVPVYPSARGLFDAKTGQFLAEFCGKGARRAEKRLEAMIRCGRMDFLLWTPGSDLDARPGS